MKGLFINNKKAKDSIYESGFMVYECLLLCKHLKWDYIEIDISNRQIPKGYDFYFFNYHPFTMPWLETRTLKKYLGFCITMVLEVAPNDPFVYCPSSHFNAYCVLDPTVKLNNKNVYVFPRPLEKVDFTLPVANNPIPVIGTFGFATKGKGFQHVVEAVNKEFDEAIVKINIPYGDFVANSKEYAFFLADVCKQRAKDGIEVQVTHDFMSKKELISWCAANTLNCFLYDRNMPGLAATTDQAVSSGQALAVSNNDTFRHITRYLPPYPRISLKESISKSSPIVKKIREDWSQDNFARIFEGVIEENRKEIERRSPGSSGLIYELALKQNSLQNFIEHRSKKYKRKVKNYFITLFKNNDSKHPKEII